MATNSTLASRFTSRGCKSYRSASPITDAQIKHTCPAILAEDKHASRSARYSYVPTHELLRGLRTAGFDVYQIAQGGSRVEGKAEFTKHFMRLRHRDSAAIALKDGRKGSFEICAINSHDGTSCAWLIAGWLEFVCLNGLVVGDIQGEVRVKHSGNAVEEYVNGAHSILAYGETVSEQRSEMASLQLTSGQQHDFARAALNIRFADAVEAGRPLPITTEQLLTPRRSEDAGSSLWDTFNRCQEGVIVGGQRKLANPRRREFTREVNSPDTQTTLNRSLWSLASNAADMLTGRAA